MRTLMFVIALAGISSVPAQLPIVSASPQVSCVTRTGDDLGYLKKVCEYVQKHNLQVTSDPNTWNIKRIEKREHNGKPVTLVYLSCCYLGDVAAFDAKGEIIDYALGPK